MGTVRIMDQIMVGDGAHLKQPNGSSTRLTERI